MQISKELLSNKPTHTHDGVLVKVFTPTVQGYYLKTKEKVFTAEIMEGESKGKWTTVFESKLKPCNS